MGKLREFFARRQSPSLVSDLTLALVVSIFCCIFFSTGCSFLYPGNNYDFSSIDSNVFNYEAYLLLMGKTPYIDFYDHKGMLHIYIDAFGLLIGGRYGVLALEMIFTTASLFLTLRCLQELFGDKWAPRLLALAAYCAFMPVVLGGNQEGEWLLPLTTAGIYFFIRGLNEKGGYNFYLSALFAGLEVGCAINIRPSDALWGGAIAIALACYAIRNRLYKKLLLWALPSIGSCLLVIGIIALAAYCGGYLEPMIKALTQNFAYVGNQKDMAAFILSQRIALPVVWAIGLFIYWKNRKAENYAVHEFFFVMLSVSCLIYFVICRYFIYYWSGLSFYLLLLCYWVSLIPQAKEKKEGLWNKIKATSAHLRMSSLAAFLALISLGFAIAIPTCYYVSDYQGVSYQTYLKIREDLLTIPEEDRKSEGNIVGIDVNASIYAGSYINPLSDLNEITVSTPYYAFQTWWAQDNPEIGERFVAYLLEEKPKYILLDVVYGEDYTLDSIDAVIESNYSLYQNRKASENNGRFDIYALNS